MPDQLSDQLMLVGAVCRRNAKMRSVWGPKSSELDRVIEAGQDVESRTAAAFDQDLVLIAPPLIFQTRTTDTACSAAIMQPILAAQVTF